ncbi:MAG: Si-specific NAD(P)(+) transhydrogenase, partial [Pirellulales bacterium]|nr:Si-specific NAD(P)(+) transhydrogenase [Pirellulales bacterium]
PNPESAPFDFDVLVIGTGPAGQRAAIAAAKLEKRVGIIDRRMCMGGVCVNTGTIPSKTLREAVLYLTGHRMKSVYGRHYRVKEDITMADLLVHSQRVIHNELDVIQLQMSRNDVLVLTGEASFSGPHEMIVSDGRHQERVSAETIILAPGTEPARPSDVQLVPGKIIDSDGLLCLPSLPKTMTIVGGGIIGIEYASMFATLGVKINVLERSARLLEFLDEEIDDALVYHLRDCGVTFRMSEEVVYVEMDGDDPVALLASGKRVRSDVLLFSTGRQGRTRQLNLEAAGLATDARGRLKVNLHFQTDVPHIYAAGDVIGFPALASTSMEQGRLAAMHACGKPCTAIRELHPYAIYAIPELSMVGKTEEQLTRECVPFESGVAHYREIAKGQILGDEIGLLKLLFQIENHKILGVHAIGEGASELIHIGQAVMALGGTVEYFRDTVFNYPTLAECYKVAAYAGLNKL